MKRLVIAALLASACLTVADIATKAQDVQTIRVGWTIPAEEAKYWMMRRPEKFPNLGKGYKIEWSQFQGTSPMSQALIAGALDCATQGVLPIAQGMDKQHALDLRGRAARRRAAGQLLGLLGGEGRLARSRRSRTSRARPSASASSAAARTGRSP